MDFEFAVLDHLMSCRIIRPLAWSALLAFASRLSFWRCYEIGLRTVWLKGILRAEKIILLKVYSRLAVCVNMEGLNSLYSFQNVELLYFHEEIEHISTDDFTEEILVCETFESILCNREGFYVQ